MTDPRHYLAAADLPGHATARVFSRPVEASKRQGGEHGPSPLRDDDGAPVIRDLPDMYTLSVASDLAQLLDELTDTN